MTESALREHDALIAAGMRANEMSVFHTLRVRADPRTGEVRDDLPALARSSGLSLRPFRRALRALESIGVVTNEMVRRQGGPQGSAWIGVRRALPFDLWAAQTQGRSEAEEAVTLAATTESIATKPVHRDIGFSHEIPGSSSGALAATKRVAEMDDHTPSAKEGQKARERVEPEESETKRFKPLGLSASVNSVLSDSISSSRPGSSMEARIGGASTGAVGLATRKQWRDIVRPPEGPRKAPEAPNPEVAAHAIETHSGLLAVLQGAPGWPYDQTKDALMLAEAARMYPMVDLACEVWQFYWWRVDRPDHAPTRRGFGRFMNARAKYDRRGAESQREWQRANPSSPVRRVLPWRRAETDNDHVDSVLVELQDIPDFSYDAAIDRKLIEQIVTENAGVDVLSAVWRWDVYLTDNPLGERQSSRAHLRAFVRNLVAWGDYTRRAEVS
jgi:hypothetical protein